MAKITDYTDGGAIQPGDEFIVARSGTNVKIAGSTVYADLYRTLGFVAVTYDPRPVNASVTQTLGALHGNAAMLRAGDVVTAVGVFFTVAGSGFTLSKVGIYDSSSALVASSASDTTFGTATGYHDLALSSPYTVPSTGLYYLADLYVGGVAPACLAITDFSSAVSQLTTLAGSPFLFFQQLGRTDLPNPAIPVVSQVPHFYYAR